MYLTASSESKGSMVLLVRGHLSFSWEMKVLDIFFRNLDYMVPSNNLELVTSGSKAHGPIIMGLTTVHWHVVWVVLASQNDAVHTLTGAVAAKTWTVLVTKSNHVKFGASTSAGGKVYNWANEIWDTGVMGSDVIISGFWGVR